MAKLIYSSASFMQQEQGSLFSVRLSSQGSAGGGRNFGLTLIISEQILESYQGKVGGFLSTCLSTLKKNKFKIPRAFSTTLGDK